MRARDKARTMFVVIGIRILRITVCVSTVWADVDFVWKQKNAPKAGSYPPAQRTLC